MRKSDISKISMEDILQRIKRELEGRRTIPRREPAQEVLQIVSRLSTAESHQSSLRLDNLLWKYGTKYAKTINRIPVLKNIAKKQYLRLIFIKQCQSSEISPPQTNHMDLDFLGTNWYYHDFLEQTKKEGLRGSIKRFILKYIGFHTWWQGQVNRAIYQELIRQKDIIEDKYRIIQEALEETIVSVKSDLNHNMETLKQEISNISLQIRDHRQQILGHQRSLKLLLEEVHKHTMEVLSTDQIHNMLKEEEHLLDGMDMAFMFMDRFRGKREDIKKRMNVYLPYIIGAGGQGETVLDIGCGRGEWLELCQENHLVAKGVDNNQAMAHQCLELGFDVVEEDAIVFLRKQKANTFGGITGFHLIEHLSYQTIVALFDEVLRVLKPGGIVIFETPNPENVLVGSCNFYMDPTHKTPLVPELVKFLAEQRGFVRTEILRVNKRKEAAYTGNEFLDEIIDRFNMEQDYAFIGYKP